MLKELVAEYDSVSLPGFGTFAAVEMPASFSDRGFTIDPPYRKLSFYQIESYDTLLIDLYAKSNNVDFGSARAIICRFMTELSGILDREKTLVFPGLGRIKSIRKDVCLFIPDANLNIAPNLYGLQPISLKPYVKPENSRPIVMKDVSKDIVVPEPAPYIAVPDSEPAETESETSETKETGEMENAPIEKPEQEKETLYEEREVRDIPKRSNRWWVPVNIILLVLSLALATFLFLAWFAPDFIDSILYSPEELIILDFFDTHTK